MAFTERMILDLLHARYSGENQGARRYAVAEHVADGVGLAAVQSRRVADFIAQDTATVHVGADGRRVRGRVRMTESGKYKTFHDGAEPRIQLHGHEVKVSRSDWLSELRDPSKSQAWMQYCDRWWLVAPADVVKDDLPEGWGLLVPSGKVLRAAVHAPRLNPVPMPVEVRAALLRAVQATSVRQTDLSRRIARALTELQGMYEVCRDRTTVERAELSGGLWNLQQALNGN